MSIKVTHLKKVINKILVWLNFSIIALILALVVLIAGLYFFSEHLSEYRSEIEQFASKVVQRPVQIGHITIGNHGLEPVLRLSDVVIFDSAKQKKLLKVRELQIGIDLVGSLITWQLRPDLLIVRGSELVVYQKRSGRIKIVGIPMIPDHVEEGAGQISSWLFEQSRLDLEELGLTWHLANGEMIKLRDLSLKLYNGVLQHELKASGKLVQQKSPAIFHAVLKLYGDVLKPNGFSVNGKLAIENWSSEFGKGDLSTGDFGIGSGELNLSVKNSKISSSLFRQPIAINGFDGKVVWQPEEGGLKVKINQMKVMDDWLTLTGDSQLLFLPKAAMPIVDIQLGIKLTNLAKAKLYYPTTLLPPDATHWLDQAFVSSDLFSGSIVLQGPLDKFPFDHQEGKFLVDTTIRDVCLNYDPEWPRVDNLSGQMIFAGRSMTILAHSAKILQTPTKLIKAVIPDLDLPVLHIEGGMDSDSSVGLRFVKECPLKQTIGRKLADVSLIGPMKFRLKFVMPLSDDLADQTTKVDGNIELDRNQLYPEAWGFGLENLGGKLHFDSDSLGATNLQGELFNQSVNLTVGTINTADHDVITRIGITGNAKIEDVEKTFGCKLSSYVAGQLDYHAMLDLYNLASQDCFKLSTDLKGVEIKLPEPLAKKPESTHHFSLTSYFGGGKPASVSINYHDQINAALTIKKTTANQLQILAGEVRLGKGPVKIPEGSGLMVTGSLNQLNWPIWKSYLTKLSSNFAASRSLIRKINLNINELVAFDQVFKPAALRAELKEKGWEVALVTSNIDGVVYMPHDPKAAIRGEFKKLHLTSNQSTFSEVKPQNLPPLNLKIDSLHYGSKQVDQVILVTEPQLHGVKINNLVLSGTNFKLEGSGEWLVTGTSQYSKFRGKLSSDNVGELLKQWDLTNNLVAGKGAVNFTLKWPDALYQPSIPTVSGKGTLDIVDGRIINLSRQTENKLGFGRVLSLLSLQSLPRRLTLDFSDLVQKGFAFDRLKGEFEFAKGNVLVEKLTLDSAMAHVEASGRLGLNAQDYNLMLKVAPHIPTSLPVATAATVLGGPVVGIVSLVADNLLSKLTKKILKKSVNYSYRITGSWENPNVTKI